MAELSLSMSQNTETLEENRAVADLRVKLRIAKQESLQTSRLPAQLSGRTFYMELDLSKLPLPVKKHLIITGVIQGNIFEYSEAIAYIKDSPANVTKQGNTTGTKKLPLYIMSSSVQSNSEAAELIEFLLNEVIGPKNQSIKMPAKLRPLERMLKKEFEIKTLREPVINYIVTKGIINGEIYTDSGAVVCTRGSPYLSRENSPSRPLYLLIRGPNEKALCRATEKIKTLIKEATELFLADVKPGKANDDDDDVEIMDNKTTSSSQPHSHRETIKKPGNSLTSLVFNLKDIHPTRAENDQNIESKVKQCVVLVHWLLAHPLLVSFVAKSPEVYKVNKASEPLVVMALLSFIPYNRFKCTHSSEQKNCPQCHRFFHLAQKETLACCMNVLKFGFDIPMLLVIEDYIKSLPPKQIGVLYDYALPKSFYDLNGCRLFIDLVINCGFDVWDNDIESYLNSTKQWYPLESYKHLYLSRNMKCTPTKNPKTHHYPLYSPAFHYGGLVNFKLNTIREATSDHLVKPNADPIPKCLYFPFLEKISAPSNLLGNESTRNSSLPNNESKQAEFHPSKGLKNRKSLPSSSSNIPHVAGSVPLQQTVNESGKTSGQSLQSAGMLFHSLVEQSQSDLKINLSTEWSPASAQSPLKNKSDLISNSSRKRQNPPTLPRTQLGEPPGKIQKIEHSLPPSFLVMQEPKGNSNQSRPGGQPHKIGREPKRGRKLRKFIRMQKEEEKRRAIAQTVSAWTTDMDIVNTQLTNVNLINAQFTNTDSTNTQLNDTEVTSVQTFSDNSSLSNKQLLVKPPQLILPNTVDKPFVKQEPPCDNLQQSAFSEVINKLQEFLQGSGTPSKDEPTENSSDNNISPGPDESVAPNSAQLPDDSHQITSQEQTVKDPQQPEDNFSSVIQKLQQFIEENKHSHSQEHQQGEKD